MVKPARTEINHSLGFFSLTIIKITTYNDISKIIGIRKVAQNLRHAQIAIL